MKKAYYNIFLLLSFLLLSASNGFGQCATDVPAAERQALIDLYTATAGASWTNSTNWNTATHVCEWYGVTVVNETITSIVLSGNNLSGTIPSGMGTLTNLTNLDLGSNQLTGGIPTEIGNLSSLTHLHLNTNQLTGTIPTQLGSLLNLTDLRLHGNQLAGNIPIELGSLTVLTVLQLNHNLLTGGIPSQLGSLSNLGTLQLTSNQLTGSIPIELGDLSSLTQLFLNQNQLTGTIPLQLGSLSNLTLLHLNANQLTGSIPVEIGNLFNLVGLQLNSNQLTGSIPIEIGNLTNLTHLYLSINQLTGSIPIEIGNLINLTHLNLAANQLTGTIPLQLGNLISLKYFNLGFNQLIGDIPSVLSSLTNLENLLLSDNQLTGIIPSQFVNLTKLKQIRVYRNALSGNIPSGLKNISTLNDFWFHTNAFVFSNFESDHAAYTTNLTTYTYSPQAKVDQVETPTIIEGNSYTFTTSLSSLSNSYQWYKDGALIIGATSKDYTINPVALTDAGVYHVLATNNPVTGLTLERNTITLAVTCGVSHTERDALMALYNATAGGDWTNTLANNQPWDISIPVCDWYGVTVINGLVTVLNLKNNGLAGNIPIDIGDLSNLTHLYLDTNQLISTIPSQLGNLSNLIVLDLSVNQLDGNIPSQLGGLTSLNGLNLGLNKLDGNIPSQLGSLLSLKEMYLFGNELTGSIPASFGNLLNLEKLWLTYNKLTGDIPSQLLNLSLLNEFLFQDNAFVFSNFETEHPTYTTNILTYTYSPQAKVDQVETINVTEGNPFTLNTSLTSLSNNYQWEFSNDGGATFNPRGIESNTYTVSAATALDAGIYRFFATNDVITGLTLERHTMTVNVNPGLPTNPTYCGEKVSAELALTNLLNHLIDEVKAGTTTFSPFYNPIEMQALAPYIDCEDPGIYTFQYLSGEGSSSLMFTYGIDCCQVTIDLYWSVCKDTIGVGGQDIIDGLATISGVSIDESGTAFKLKYDFINDCTSAYTYNNQNIFPLEETITCLNINCSATYNPNAFCYPQLEDALTVADLTPGGNSIIWYSAETGGQQYSNTDELIDEAAVLGGVTYWWDDTTDGIVTRTAANVELFIDIEGDSEQIFSKYATPAPTLADIDVVNSFAPIYWYENDSSTTVLDINTFFLVDGQTYYASSCNSGDNSCFCRFPVTVFIGVIPPKGDPVQYVCEQSELDDIVKEIENVSGMSVNWYDSEVGGNPLAGNTPVVDGITYYAAQIDGNSVESSNRLGVLVYVKSTDDPVVTETSQTFYATDPPAKVKDLKATGIEILWYSQSTGGVPYDPEFDLVNGIYYAEQVFGQCPSVNRLAVTVTIEAEPAQPLLGCELFRPEFLKSYVIDAWVNEREVITDETTAILFNGSKESVLFVALLNHLKNRLMSENEKLHDIPEAYEPEFTGDEEQLDLAPLMAYVEGLAVSEKKLIVYDFKPINDGYRRAIGFSFYLNEAKAPGTQFLYKTPTFTYTIPKKTTTGVVQETKTEHYPLLDNITTSPDEYLKFTDVKVKVGGVFEMHADFNQVSEPILQKSQILTLSDLNVIKSESIYKKYKEVSYQAVPTYEQANIEIRFVDADNIALGVPIVFNAHGEIIDKWQKITGKFTVPNGAGRMIISLKNDDVNKVAYFDDLRIYPYDGQMKSFVYHPENQRLMSELDENNYATFYEYDPEGGLIRVKKETVKGIYTIQETRSGNIKATN